MWICVCISVYMYVHLFVCKSVCMCGCVYMRMRVYVCYVSADVATTFDGTTVDVCRCTGA